MPGKSKPPPLKVEQGLFLTIGVPEGTKGKVQIKRAAEILQRQGFRVGVTSPEAILAVAEEIRAGQELLESDPLEEETEHDE